jgi:hypothetical protein
MKQAIVDHETAIVVAEKFNNTSYFKRYLEYSYNSIEAWKFSPSIKKLVEQHYPMLDCDKFALSTNDIGYIQDMDNLRKMRQEKLNQTISEESQENACETELVVL